MKKYFVLVLLLLFIFPFGVNAAEIKSISISAPTSAKVGESITITVPVNILGITTSNRDGLGIFYAGFSIEYNENDLIYTNIYSSDLESEMYEDPDTKEKYIIGMLLGPVTSKNKCQDNFLFCGDYSVAIEFFVKNTNESKTTIKVSMPEAGLFELTKDNQPNYDTDNMIIIEGTNSYSKNISIIKTESPVVKEPESNINKTPPSTSTPPKAPTTSSKSSNNYASSIKIEDYSLNFSKYDNNYVVKINKDVNNLKLKVELDDTNSTYEIVGADDLKNSDYKIHVIVTAQDGTKNTYNINARIDKDVAPATDKTEEPKSEDKQFIKLTKKQMMLGGGIAAGIIVLILIALIINKIKNKKIDKALGNL